MTIQCTKGGGCVCAMPHIGCMFAMNYETKTFEQRMEDRVERQIKLAEENNKIMKAIAIIIGADKRFTIADIEKIIHNG